MKEYFRRELTRLLSNDSPQPSPEEDKATQILCREMQTTCYQLLTTNDTEVTTDTFDHPSIKRIVNWYAGEATVPFTYRSNVFYLNEVRQIQIVSPLSSALVPYLIIPTLPEGMAEYLVLAGGKGTIAQTQFQPTGLIGKHASVQVERVLHSVTLQEAERFHSLVQAIKYTNSPG